MSVCGIEILMSWLKAVREQIAVERRSNNRDLPGYLISRPQPTRIHSGQKENVTENSKQKTAAAANVHQMSRSAACADQSADQSIDRCG